MFVFTQYKAEVTNLFAIAGHFVSYRWVIGPHNYLVILWKLLVQDCWSRLNAKVQDCWSRLNASRAARNSFVGRMFVTPGIKLRGLPLSAVTVSLHYLPTCQDVCVARFFPQLVAKVLIKNSQNSWFLNKLWPKLHSV